VAISFSRPDPSSPAAVADANFPTSRRGFDQQEVRDFLRMVAAELARAQERERYLEQELRARRQQLAQPGLPAELDDETVARLLGEETTRIVQAARESATTIRTRAEETAERLVRDARDEAQRLREDAELEAVRRRKDADTDAEAELEMAKQQGREMVEEARAYRERALAELARRRDLARQQIDQLVHGRDRLLQAFERARLAASDVVSDLQPLGELDEYVNLSPTTGPVPVMVPASRLAAQSSIAVDALAERASSDPADPALDTAEPEPEPEPVATVAEDDETAEIESVAAAAEPTDTAAATDTAEAAAAEATDTAEATETTDAADVTDTAEPTDAGAPPSAAPAEPPAVGRNATVLRFPSTVEPPTDALVDEAEDDDITANDVDDLFARLRAQRDTTPAAPAPATGVVDGALFEQRDEALTPLITASARKLKRVLADEQNSALDRLRGKEAVATLDDLLPAEADHVARYADAIAADVLAAVQAGADSVTPDTSVGDAPLAAVRTAIRDDLVAPLRARLADRIGEAAGDNEAITRSARAVYREWKTKHIDDHLDDFLRLAFGHGLLAAMPPGASCRWVADPTVGPCSDCEDNTLQGLVPAGSPYPTGHVTAPAHAGCRCLITRADR